MADRLEHPPHLALAPLLQHELHAVGRQAADAGRRRHAVVELDALAQRAQRRLAHGRAADARAVDPRNLERRVGQPVGELAVVGEQQQAGRVGVEAPDGVQALAAADERDDGRAPLRILGGRDVAGGLVERVDHMPALERRRAGRRPRSSSWSPTSRAGSRTTSPPTVTRPANDQLLGGPARGDPRVGEVFARGAWRCHHTAMDLPLLDATLAELGQPAFRARQVWRWTATGAPATPR